MSSPVRTLCPACSSNTPPDMTVHQRHRRHGRFPHRRLIITGIAALCAVVILLFVLLCFLASPPVGNDHVLHVRIHNDVDQRDAAPIFQVPDSGGSYGRDLWRTKNAELYYGCSSASSNFEMAASTTQPNRYLAIATSGGLNQQRIGITDAVVAGYILNATLVIPKLDKNSFWKDASNFSDIFDVDWFISYLKNDVKIIKELPRRHGEIWNPHRTRVPRKCDRECYISHISPLLTKMHAVQLTKFDYRLSNRLTPDLQKLRCRANYHALKFSKPIREMGAKLVQRMRARSKYYIALHLRFEPDMLAFSGCYYGGGDKERQELAQIRKRWKDLHRRNPEKQRRQGRCPLTPEEVGLLLRALGYDNKTHMYVASGQVYGGEASLAPLQTLFPNFYSKETLAPPEELKPFSPFSSRNAALDFLVCDESDVFVSNNNGNMAQMLSGRRRYFGHKPTIRLNAKRLYKLFPMHRNITWEAFATSVHKFQKGFMGDPEELRPGWGGFHENPAACICKAQQNTNSVTNKLAHEGVHENQNIDGDEHDIQLDLNEEDDNSGLHDLVSD